MTGPKERQSLLKIGQSKLKMERSRTSKIMGIWLEESNADSAKGTAVSICNTRAELEIKITYFLAINSSRALIQLQLTQFTIFPSTTILESNISRINNTSEATQQS